MLRFFTEICEFVFFRDSSVHSTYKCIIQMRNTNDVIIQNVNNGCIYSVSSVCSSTGFEEAGQYGLGRSGFSNLSLKDEQRLSIRAVYEGSSVFMWLLTLERACVIKS